MNDINDNETFAIVLKSMIWKSQLALGVKFDYKIEQFDIIIAFLESLMTETVYIELQQRCDDHKLTSCT